MQQHTGFEQYGFGQPFYGALAGGFFHGFGQVLWADAEFVGIKGEAALVA